VKCLESIKQLHSIKNVKINLLHNYMQIEFIFFCLEIMKWFFFFYQRSIFWCGLFLQKKKAFNYPFSLFLFSSVVHYQVQGRIKANCIARLSKKFYLLVHRLKRLEFICFGEKNKTSDGQQEGNFSWLA